MNNNIVLIVLVCLVLYSICKMDVEGFRGRRWRRHRYPYRRYRHLPYWRSVFYDRPVVKEIIKVPTGVNKEEESEPQPQIIKVPVKSPMNTEMIILGVIVIAVLFFISQNNTKKLY